MTQCPKIKTFSSNRRAKKFVLPDTSLRSSEKFHPAQSAISLHSMTVPTSPSGTVLTPRSRHRLAKVSGSEKSPAQSTANSEIFSLTSSESEIGKIKNFVSLETGAKVNASPKSKDSNASPKHRRQSASPRIFSTQRNDIKRGARTLRISTKKEPFNKTGKKEANTLKVQTCDKTELSTNLSPTLKNRFCADKTKSFAFSPKSLDTRDNLIKNFLKTKV